MTKQNDILFISRNKEISNESIYTIEKLLDISLYDWQINFLKGSRLVDMRRASGKTYIYTLAYTLGLISIEELRWLDEKPIRIVDKINHDKYIASLNKFFIDKLKDVEKNFLLEEFIFISHRSDYFNS